MLNMTVCTRAGCGSVAVALSHTTKLHLESFCRLQQADIISSMTKLIFLVTSLVKRTLLTRIQSLTLCHSAISWSIPERMFVFNWISLEQVAITGWWADWTEPLQLPDHRCENWLLTYLYSAKHQQKLGRITMRNRAAVWLSDTLQSRQGNGGPGFPGSTRETSSREIPPAEQTVRAGGGGWESLQTTFLPPGWHLFLSGVGRGPALNIISHNTPNNTDSTIFIFTHLNIKGLLFLL